MRMLPRALTAEQANLPNILFIFLILALIILTKISAAMEIIW
jgi:hypothetical protein